jgi:hypothetical protein
VTTSPQTPLSESNEIRIRLNAALIHTLLEMAALASTPPEGFASQLLEAAAADFRLKRVAEHFPITPRGEQRVGPGRRKTGRGPLKKVDPDKEDEIRDLFENREATVEALAARYRCSGTTIRRITIPEAAMRPRGTRKHFHQRLTAVEKRRILALARKRTKQIEIAQLFGCSVSTIQRVEKAASLKRWREITPEIEREVVRVLRAGNGQYRTAKLCRVSQPEVHKLMLKHKIRNKGGGHGLPIKKRAAILDRVLQRENFANHIAEKENVSPPTVLEIAHAMFGPHRFSTRGVPFTSAINAGSDVEANFTKFAENIVRKTVLLEGKVEAIENQMDTIFVTMIEKHLELWHSGQVPSDRKALVEEILEINMPKVLRGKSVLTLEQWDWYRGMTEQCIKTALDHVAGPESRWTN